MNTKPNTMIIDYNTWNLSFTMRVLNQLTEGGITTVGQLMSMTENDLLKIPNIGRKAIQEIKLVLAEQGVSIRQELLKIEKQTLSPDRWDKVLVGQLDLGILIFDSLLSAGYQTVGDLRKVTETDLRGNTDYIGDEEMKQIKQQLAAFGCKLKD